MMGRGADGGCGTEERPCPASRASSSALSGPSGRAVDLYAQARKALTERSPFAGVDETLRVATLPILLAGSLARHGDGRRKKAHADEHGKKAAHAPQLASGLWDETEEYFRSVTLSDIDLLEFRLPCAGDACLHIPINCLLLPHTGDHLFSAELEVHRDDTIGIRVDEAEVVTIADIEQKEAEQEQEDMEIDEMDDEQKNDGVADVPLDEEIVEEQRVEEDSDSTLNWLLTSRHRALLTSERPNKKRKLLGSDAGLERVLRLPPPEGEVLPLCDYCCNQAGGGKLDWSELLSCRSCDTTVHRKCYGVQDAGAWACARCKYLEEVGKPLNCDGESSCLLCPREGGALKLVEEDRNTVNEGVRFVHLFCSLWMPELYVEREETMGPIMNVKEIPESRMKLVCNVCKVKHGACVRCSNGACRASFHPSCARGAKHKMEIWGKVGCDNVELRVFCAKHSDVQESSPPLKNLNVANGTTSQTCKALATGSSMNSPIADKGVTENEKHAGDDALASNSQSDLHESCDDGSVGVAGPLSDSCPSQLSKFVLVLKKLTEIGKVKIHDVESETGMSSEALNSVLQGDSSFLSPDLQLKLIKWVQDSDYIDAFPRNLKSVNKDALSANEPENNVKYAIQDLDGSDAICITEGDSSDVIVKSLPPRRRTRGNIRIVKENEVDTLPSGIVAHRDHIGEMCYDAAEIPIIFDNGVKEDRAFRSIINEVRSKDKENLKSLVDDGSSKITPSSNDLPHEKGYAIIPPLQGNHSFSGTCERLSCPDDELVLAKARIDNRNIVSLMTAFAKAKELGITEHSPEDELEGEIINLQNKLLDASLALKSHYDNLILKVVSGIPDELEVVKKQRWDMVFVNRFLREIKEAKKRGRKERRQKEAQAILAAATAAATSSRVLSIRKDAKEEFGSVQEQRRKDKPPKLVTKLSSGKHSDANVVSCDICRRQETLMRPLFVCAGCKVAVHLNCYRMGKDPISSWYCEPCELKFDSYGSEPSIEYRETLSYVPQCSLCGATTGAFRKSTDGKWVHAFCAEWVLGSRFKRGQEQPVEGVDTLLKTKELLSCCICHQHAGICIKCCYGHCQTAFHPICARGAGLFMNSRTIGGNIQYKAYCEKHSQEQREKAEYQHGVEEFKNLRQTRVELEKLRLLCERIIKREKMKRELVVCSHEILSSRRDYVAMSVIARSPFLSSGFSSESATTSINNTSYSGIMERSDDVTVDSTLSGRRRAIPPLHIKFDRSGEASVMLNPPSTRMITDRTSVSGKQLPQRPASYDKPVNEGKRLSKRGKIREILQTSDQTSSWSQRLPKGFVHVPSENMSKSQDIESCEPPHPDG